MPPRQPAPPPGREYALFEGVGGGAPLAGEVSHLRQVLEGAPPAKRTAVLGHLTKCLQPVMEKALLHPPMTHRWAAGAGKRVPSVWVGSGGPRFGCPPNLPITTLNTPANLALKRLIRELLEAAPGSVVADAVDTLAATGGSVLKMVRPWLRRVWGRAEG